ncbi:DNA-dependent protein kinase catalytic subunit isoform X2 [Pleurodeles waltl]|uniref:DNA-dependent protein kinase catalytic subunit isoform X2 n=1 Tax=Pleurodeles waltl TaxID=8319 RepID=UPI003709B3A9
MSVSAEPAAGVGGILGALHQLHALLSSGDAGPAAPSAQSLIRSMGQECLSSAGESLLAFQTSLVFSKDYGLLEFVYKSLNIEDFRDCREEALKFLCAFQEKIGQDVHPYACDVKDKCIVIYMKDKAAKCKVPALELLIKVLRCLKNHAVIEEFKVGDIFKRFYGELAAKTKVPDTVLEKIYELLGVLGEVQPSDMLHNSDKLFRAYLGELKTQMTSGTREPKLPVVAGCLKGLTALMLNFTKSVDEDARTSKEIFDYAVKAINPQVDFKRYAVPLAGLQLFTLHAAQFSTFLMDNYYSLFEAISKWCGHTNPEMKKTSHSALDSFLKQIALMVSSDPETHKKKLQFFMEQFYKIIRKLDSTSKELSIAIRGYGLFAAPCKAVNAKDVDIMYIELIQRCKQMYLTEADTEDDNLYQLPNFLQSIASVILHLEAVPEVYTPVLERLLVLQIDSFSQYSPKMQSLCCRAIIKVFLAMAGKGPVLWSFISTVVHQGLIRVCSKPISPEVSGKSAEPPAVGEVRTGKWKVPTYKDYVDLFRNLLNCDKMKESVLAEEMFTLVNSPLQSLNRLLYDELIKSVLKIIEKLDLSLEKQDLGRQDDDVDASALVIPTSDPAANLQPTKPKDFTAFINLVEFCREILPEKHVEYFEPWVYVFGYELILQSTRLPLISGFYKLLSVAMKNAKRIKYFEGVSSKSYRKSPVEPERVSCFALFAKFGKEISSKMKQYKDELLASCLVFVLSLPHDIIMLDIKAYIPALQTAFKLGLSCAPLADAGIDALEDWSSYIPRHVMQPCYKDILPFLDGYLKTTGASDEPLNAWEAMHLTKASQKGFNRILIQKIKKAKTLSVEDGSSLAEVRVRVVRLLGSLGGQINRSLVTAASSEEMMKKCVSWDTEKRLNFAVPFADMKPVIYLDVFLPRVTELALSASDRQTKVAACELLHSMVVFMLGKSTQIPEGCTGYPPMYQLYKHTFPVLLRLACDVDQVTRQLYEPLIMGLIHWFTNNKKFESQDTVALLEAVLDGIVDPIDSTLRDFCGQCVREFLKWSIKQTTPQQQEKSPVNTKSLFKRLYSLALHPNAFKRLGASLAFNNIYREFREENVLVEQFVFEALVVYLESLALTHADEKSLGTVQQCCDAIDHLKRIIIQKAPSLVKAVKRRLPRGFPPEQTSLCLSDIVMWLLVQCGRPQTECRHKSMELFFEFVPLLPGNKTPSAWLDHEKKREGPPFLINRFEGAGNIGDKQSGIMFQPTLHDLLETFSLRAVVQWMDMFLAALDCYNTFIGMRVVKPHEILGTEAQSSFLRALKFFLGRLALNDVIAAEQCFTSGPKGTMFSPQEREQYNYSKCTIIVRIMEFVSMVIENCQQDFWKVLEKDLLNSDLFELVAASVCDPPSVGFNIADVQVMKHLPDVCVKLMKAVINSPYRSALESCIKKRITPRSIEELCAIDLYSPDARFSYTRLSSILSACKQLYKAGLLDSALQSKEAGHRLTVGWKLLSVVYKGIAPGDERKSLPSLDISSRRLAEGLLQLAFDLGGQCEELVSLLLNTVILSVPLSGTSQRNLISFSHGEYFYSLFSETINTELLKNLDTAVLQLMKSAMANAKMVGTILNGMLDESFRQRSIRKLQGAKLVTAVVQNWSKLDSWWNKDSGSESKMAVVTLLAKVLQVDSSFFLNNQHEAFTAVFQTYTSILTDQKLGLNLKSQAVIILPFFTNLTGSKQNELKDSLDQLVAFNFPMKSDEFAKGTLKYNNYVDCVKKFLDALDLSQSPMLLQLMTEILCRDKKHFMEDLFQSSFRAIAKRSNCEKQVALLDTVHKMFLNENLLSNITRQSYVDRSLLTLLWHSSLDALIEFFYKTIVNIMDTMKSRFTKLNEQAFDTQVTKKMGYYKMLEILYLRLPKEDIYSKESKINQAFHGSSNTEGNELTKNLIKSCYDSFSENMTGETQLLEKRRQYHCAAYNCAIAVISCVFTESKFYHGFLFTEKPEKSLFIFENLIDLHQCYTFPVEVEVPLEKKRKYVTIRKLARDVSSDPEEPRYLSSQSYMADSSLSEEMSQFDFSTGVQSFSYSSQDPTAQPAHSKRKEQAEPTKLGDFMELEMDELNRHECMSTMVGLINHMHQNQIIPKVEEGVVPQDLPPWMKFLHGKLANPSTPLNIRLFIAKLVVNTEEVFQPYARHWLGPLLQLVVSGNNGGEGIHYMVVEIVVTLLSWTSVAVPLGFAKDEILANRLLDFLMKNAFHEKRAVFRHNLEIIKTVLECWKDCLSVPYSLIFERFSSGDPNTKDNSVGIQLLGLVLANNLPPYDPKCGINSDKYFQALTNNLALIRYQEVYAAAAEVLGLVLRYVAEKDKVLDGPIFDLVLKELKKHQSTKEDKFIMCLNKVAKNFPPLADRFMTVVFYLLPKLHGVLKTYCLEVIMYRAEEIPDIYIQLKSKDFNQVMNHRDDERQKVCLDIVHKVLAKLHPSELKELLPAVLVFSTHPSPLCRERMYNILMWIYDNYRDPESQMDSQSQEVFNLAKESLLQGLTDEDAELQLIVRNFWSNETRLPTSTFDRMLALLSSLYSPKIETSYLSLATNLLLEMTSRSPDYVRQMFEHPLSECRFQDHVIDSNWRYRSTILTPMFLETQASQSSSRHRTQDASLTAQGSLGGQLRATQLQYEFTPTQNVGARSFNWLTGSSMDTLADYVVPSASDSLSSTLFFQNKKKFKSSRAPFKPLGPNFGKKMLGLPGDEVDTKAKGIEEKAEILRLRRRFLKDQEKVSLIYAKKGAAEQKREKEITAEMKIKQDAQVTLYRRYRHGDLPDIQIEYRSLIAPLQALAQRDSTLAKQLFSNLFSGILKEMEQLRNQSEMKEIAQMLLENFNRFLSISVTYFPPFVACIQDMSYQHKELLNLDSANVSTSCLASLQQPMGILLLEKALLNCTLPEEPPAKKMRRTTEFPCDVVRWIELAKLYRSVGDYDVLRGIFSGKLGTKSVTQEALLAEAKSDYSKAAQLYDEALNTEEWSEGAPTEAEKDFWEIASLECYNHLTEWKSLEHCSTVSIDSAQPPDLSKMWAEPFYQIYSSIDTLLHQSRLTKLQSVQALTEIKDFVSFISKPSNLASEASLRKLIQTWKSRYPDSKVDPMNIWDDIMTNRCFFLDKIQEKLPVCHVDDSMEVDGGDDAVDKMEVDEQEDINTLIKSCKFTMKMKMVESARKQNNFSVSMKILKSLHRESKTREDWLVQWMHSYCRYSHSRCQSQTSCEQMVTVMKTIPLLEESNNDYLSQNVRASRDHSLLLGTTYCIMGNTVTLEPGCLEEMEDDKARRVLEFAGTSSGNPEAIAECLYRKAFTYLTSAVKKAEEEVQSHNLENTDTAGVIEAYMTLVDFCDQHLRKEEENEAVFDSVDLQSFHAIVVEKMMKALKLNSRDARLKFPRLLQLIELYPADTLDLMTREIASIPCWQFIGWIAQMMAMLDKKQAVAVQHIVEEIADLYPQALVYPFMISSENYSFEESAIGHKNKEFVLRIKKKLDKGGVVEDFIHALEQLSNPEMLFKDWIEDAKNELAKSERNKKHIKQMYDEMYKNLGSLQAPLLGPFRRKFIQAYGKEMDKLFGKDGSKLLNMELKSFTTVADSLLSKMKECQKEPGNLKECSPWMSEFKPEFLKNELEIPGQYDGKSKPLPEYHVKISGFDERVKIMKSIRKPKRIIIRGDDEREYPFLVKGGEDLRQDQRIEQLFDVMNIILSQDAACSQRNMQLKTYQVIPMTTRIGLIEWLEKTCTLRDFLLNNMTEEENDNYLSRKGPVLHYSDWLNKMTKSEGNWRYIIAYKKANRTETVMAFRARESLVPGDLLRRAFIKMSTTPESFLALRSHFASSHALICISHWVLGIGDRHLSNFMINLETGGMVGIDFGHAFGSATQFLPVPEMMPFRLTCQFLNLMLPMRESGLINSVMIHALRAYRADPDLLINTMDVFVKEPSLDWKNFELKQLKKGGTWTKEVNTMEVNWYPMQKVNYAKRKLSGANPAVITCDELRLGHEKVVAYKDYISVARGDKAHNIRAKEPDAGLSEEVQVRCLIDQATDPNILGRVYEGWEPWM